MDAFIEIHLDGAWRKAALLQPFDDDRCRLEYTSDYVFSKEPAPVALDFPVEFRTDQYLPDGTVDHRVPPFLYDMVPQGRGRRFLIDLLQLVDHDRLVMPLLLNGAFNPIGCLRITTAVDFYRAEAEKNPDTARQDGFTLRDIETKTEDFLQHLALHAMLASGTTGVQGVAPKFLLTQDGADRWFADLALDDSRARKHWLVKLPRGRTEPDLMVHRNEAAYLRVAQACGLRVLEEPHVIGNMLFVRRFDREVGPKGVTRLHQESLASLAGTRGFGVATTQNELFAALRKHATDPVAEALEFLKRDVLNLALRNTDNHARNTAVQRLSDGTCRLTPLFDFAPMFMDPDVVPRTVHWKDAQGARLDTWQQVFDHLDVPAAELSALARGLRAFLPVVERLPQLAKEFGVDAHVIEQCRRTMDVQAQSLSRLAVPEMEPKPPASARRRSRHG